LNRWFFPSSENSKKIISQIGLINIERKPFYFSFNLTLLWV
jgi:hypothetical protein